MGAGRNKPKVTVVGDGEWMSVSEAARALKKSRHGVLVLIIKNAVEAQYIRGQTLIKTASVEKLRSQLQKAGAA